MSSLLQRFDILVKKSHSLSPRFIVVRAHFGMILYTLPNQFSDWALIYTTNQGVRIYIFFHEIRTIEAGVIFYRFFLIVNRK